jgi:hypothetical protein
LPRQINDKGVRLGTQTVGKYAYLLSDRKSFVDAPVCCLPVLHDNASLVRAASLATRNYPPVAALRAEFDGNGAPYLQRLLDRYRERLSLDLLYDSNQFEIGCFDQDANAAAEWRWRALVLCVILYSPRAGVSRCGVRQFVASLHALLWSTQKAIFLPLALISSILLNQLQLRYISFLFA